MSKCTASEAIEAAEYWVGYCEKDSERYVEYRSKKYFTILKVKVLPNLLGLVQSVTSL